MRAGRMLGRKKRGWGVGFQNVSDWLCKLICIAHRRSHMTHLGGRGRVGRVRARFSSIYPLPVFPVALPHLSHMCRVTNKLDLSL